MTRLNSENATALLVLVFTLMHLFVAGGIELSGDEAHYALYGYYLDISYFDHPPLVGWLQGLALIFSSSEFTLRLWPIALSALSGLLLYRLTRELFAQDSPWVAFVAVLLMESALMYQVVSIAMLPDSPLVALGLASALMLHRALKYPTVGIWLLFGLFIGLAGLSKYTAVTLALSAGLLILYERRDQLARPGLWLAVAVAALIVSPVFVWNMQHDWVSISYQLQHGSPDKSWELKRFLISQSGQLAGYGPAVYLGGLVALFVGLRRWKEATHRFVIVLVLPTLLLFFWNSGYEVTLPHWTVLSWVLLTPLTAKWLFDTRNRLGVRIFSSLSAVYAVLLVLVLHSELFHPWIPFQSGKYPFGDLYGWRQAAQRASQLQQQMARSPGQQPVIYAGNWSFASHLAWYARPRAVQVTDNRYTQSDIWFGSPVPGGRGILVVPAQFAHKGMSNGISHFASCSEKEKVITMIRGKEAAAYLLYACHGYRP